MSDKFKARYEIDDGYAGPSRPLHFDIHDREIEDDMDEMDLREFFRQEVQFNFEQRVFPHGSNEEDFVEWALSVLKENNHDT